MGVPVAVGAEGEAVDGAERGGCGGGAVVAKRSAAMPTGEGVGNMNKGVAGEAKPRRVGAAIEHRRRLAAVVAEGHPLRPPRPNAVPHLRPNLRNLRDPNLTLEFG